jgi:hypothetical protein
MNGIPTIVKEVSVGTADELAKTLGNDLMRSRSPHTAADQHSEAVKPRSFSESIHEVRTRDSKALS